MEGLSALFTSGIQGWTLIILVLLILFGRDLVDGVKWIFNKMGMSRVQTVSMKLDNESVKISDLQNQTKEIDDKVEGLKSEMTSLSSNLLGTETINELIRQSSEYAIETAYKRSSENRAISDKKIEEAIEFTKKNRQISDQRIDEIKKYSDELHTNTVGEIKETVKTLTDWGLKIAQESSKESKDYATELSKNTQKSIEYLTELYSKLATSQEGTQLMVLMNLYMSRGKISPSELLRLENAMNNYSKKGGNGHCDDLYNEFRTMINDNDIKITKEKVIK